MTNLKQYNAHELREFITVDALVSVHHINTEASQHLPLYGEAHSFPELVYIEEGGFDVTVDGVDFSLESGQCLIYPPCAYHIGSYCSKDACPHRGKVAFNIISFCSGSPPMAQLYNRVIDLSESQQQTLSMIVTMGRASFKDAPMGYNMSPRKNTDTIKLHKLKNNLELFLIGLFELISDTVQPKQKNYKLQQFDEVTTYLKTNIDKNLTVEDIAVNCDMSPSKLKLLFSEQCELSPIAYFTSLKIEKAKNLIRSTTLSYTQIAEMLGFKTLYYFSDRFKKKTGMSPSEYAKSL